MRIAQVLRRLPLEQEEWGFKPRADHISNTLPATRPTAANLICGPWRKPRRCALLTRVTRNPKGYQMRIMTI